MNSFFSILKLLFWNCYTIQFNIIIFTTIFFGIFTFAQEEPETIVPENPEQLVNDSIDIQSGTIKNLQQAQERIDKLDTESKRLTNEYKDTIVEFEILNKYDNQLERITISQAEEIANITKQIEDLDETNKYVLPLLERMVITLRDLIEIDVPFLMDERMARLEELEDIFFGDWEANQYSRLIDDISELCPAFYHWRPEKTSFRMH